MTPRGARLSLGIAAAGCLIVGLAILLPPLISSRTLAMVQVPSAKPRNYPDEIMARFPKEKHEEFMRRAIANSRKAGVEYKTGGAFGAVIVDKDGNILADGMNHVIAQNDPTWHAEMHAIRQACALLKKPKLEGCILYTSSEPCPMCLATAYWAEIDGIIYGATAHDSKKYGNFDDEFIYAQFATPLSDRAISEQSLLRPEAVEVWKEYHARPDKVDY
jgi:tRNA(Arg) A34 adenosine deaminase TadA